VVHDERSAPREAERAIEFFVLHSKNRAAVERGRERGGLRALLAADIGLARALYEKHVPPNVPGRDAIFEKALVRVVAGGDASLLD
jgi:hypothetical protein